MTKKAVKKKRPLYTSFMVPLEMKRRMSSVQTLNWSAVIREAIEAKLKAEGK